MKSLIGAMKPILLNLVNPVYSLLLLPFFVFSSCDFVGVNKVLQLLPGPDSRADQSGVVAKLGGDDFNL